MNIATVGTERLNSHTVILLKGYTTIAKAQFMILNVHFCCAYQILPGCPVRLPSVCHLQQSGPITPLAN